MAELDEIDPNQQIVSYSELSTFRQRSVPVEAPPVVPASLDEAPASGWRFVQGYDLA